MRAVILGSAERERAKEIIEYAKAHPYTPEAGPPPGDHPEHTMIVPFGIRVVYSITEFAEEWFKHLSVSALDHPNHRPHPVMAEEIAAELFGFSRPLSDTVRLRTGWITAEDDLPGVVTFLEKA